MTTNVVFHARDTLGLGAPVPARLAFRTMAEQTTQKMGLTWHYTGSDGTLFRPDPIARLREIWAYHVNGRGYGDIAYEGAFDADGNTYGLRDSRYVGAHALSDGNAANRLTDGIVFLEDARGVTPAAVEAMEWWVNLYRFIAHRSPTSFAHQWWAEGHGGTPTACPGADLDTLIRFLHGNA